MKEYRKNELLIKARRDAGLTSTQVAEGIGIAYPQYSAYENGRRYPSKEMQEKICDFYHLKGIPLEEDDVFPEEIKHLARKQRIPENEQQLSTGIIYLPPSDIRYLSDRTSIGMPKYFDIETEVMQRELSERTRKVLSSLNPRYELVLKMRFGKNENTYEEIGSIFKVTQERIRQIEARALEKLRHYSRLKKLKYFLKD